MENETEPLDWGNEEEERKEAYRRASNDYAARQDSAADDEGAAEDTISLGDEEEDGYYFQREDAQINENSVSMTEESFNRPQSPRRRADSMGANDQPRYQHDSRDRRYYERNSPQPSNMRSDSPPRDRDRPSRNQTSPNQMTTTRLKHALPPKPVTAQVPYLPPSHPSIVAATSMTEISPRDTSRDTKANGTGSTKPALSSAAVDLPHPWVLRRPRSGGDNYYFNTETEESSWYHPVSSIPSSSSGQFRRRTRSGSSTDTYMKPSDSNMHQTQNSRPHSDRNISRGGTDHDMENAARIEESERQRMSYNDRHYRPGGDPATATAPVVHELQPTARSDAVSGQYSSRSRYDRSPPPASPPRPRRRARSISPPNTRMPPAHSRSQDYPPRGSHPGPRERHEYTNPGPVAQRDGDTLPRERWAQSHLPSLPPTEYDRSDRVSHKPPHRSANADDRDFDHSPHDETRPHIRRRESSRGPHRDREHPRYPDAPEYPAGNSGFQSASRQYAREREPVRDYPPYREPVPAPGPPHPDRKERQPPFDRSASSSGPPPNIGPPDREPYNPRAREYDARPSPTYDQRRGGERDYERSRRDAPPDAPPARRHPNEYPPRENPPSAAPRATRYPDPYERAPPEDPAQLSHRRRQPLPPQATSFMSVPSGREPPPQVPPQDIPVKIKPPGWANFDPSLPRRPKFEVNNLILIAKDKAEKAEQAEKAAQAEKEKATTAAAPVAAKPVAAKPTPPATSVPVYDQDHRNNGPKPQDRGRQEHAQRPPKLDTRMDIDPRDTVDTRPPSPRGMRSARLRQEDDDHYPGGPRSARPAQTPTERPAYPASASIAPPPNARFDNGHPAGLPPPTRAGNHPDDRRFNDNRLPPPPREGNHTDDRRFNDNRVPPPSREGNYPDDRRFHDNRVPPPSREGNNPDERRFNDNRVPPPSREGNNPDDKRFNDNRPEWKDNRSGNGYGERGPAPPRRDFRSRPDEINQQQPSGSGPNNVPIGNRRNMPPATNGLPFPPNGGLSGGLPPQAFGFNPDARPPSSALIRPGPNSEFQHGSLKAPVADEPRRNGPPPTPQYPAPLPAVNQPAMLSSEGDKAKRRASRFSPLVSQKPEFNQEQAMQRVPRRSPKEPHQRDATPPPMSREPSMLSEHKFSHQSDPGQSSDGRRSPTSGMLARDVGRREDRPASSRFADDIANTKSSNAQTGRMESSQTASTASVESAPSQRPRYKWSEQMANAVAPALPEAVVEPTLSRRLSSEKPPRHRKYTATQYIASEDSMPVDAPPGDPQDGTLSFKDRLENPSLSRRSSHITLLDRLSTVQDSVAVSPESSDAPTPSLRDRLVPSKRDRDDMMMDATESGAASYEGEDENKRIKRRNTKAKRGGRR